MIGPLDLSGIPEVIRRFHWCIIGGESGNDNGKYRYLPCELEWITRITRDLENTGVKVFVKQTGTWLARRLNLADRHGGKIDE